MPGIDPAEHERRKPQPENRPRDLKKKASGPSQSNPVGPSAAQPANSALSSDGQTITDEQGKRFWAMAIETYGDFKTVTAYLKDIHRVARKEQILDSRYQEAMAWAEGR